MTVLLGLWLHLAAEREQPECKATVLYAGATRVVCATIAFGMGMDLQGVTFSVHWNAARSLQDYVQRIGRGGRHGSNCLCMTMLDTAPLQNALKKVSWLQDKERKEQECEDLLQVWAQTSRK